jgi:hypothetical protein
VSARNNTEGRRRIIFTEDRKDQEDNPCKGPTPGAASSQARRSNCIRSRDSGLIESGEPLNQGAAFAHATEFARWFSKKVTLRDLCGLLFKTFYPSLSQQLGFGSMSLFLSVEPLIDVSTGQYGGTKKNHFHRRSQRSQRRSLLHKGPMSGASSQAS